MSHQEAPVVQYVVNINMTVVGARSRKEAAEELMRRIFAEDVPVQVSCTTEPVRGPQSDKAISLEYPRLDRVVKVQSTAAVVLPR